MKRPSVTEYFMNMAKTVSTRGTCDRAMVGAVLVRDGRILATGYNGAPSGMDHCDEVGHLMEGGHCKRSIHAEINALLQCSLHGVSVKGATCYVTHYPCRYCTMCLINSGVDKVVYGKRYGKVHDDFVGSVDWYWAVLGRVDSRNVNGYQCVLAISEIRQFDILLDVCDGILIDNRNKHSVQVGNRHYMHNIGMYINHSCDPNAKVDKCGLVISNCDIAIGEEVTVNYLDFETEISNSFKCNCGNSNCVGLVSK